MNRCKSLMILGTSSDVGKSVIAAGFCRLLSDWGYRVAPFKAQNMSNHSYVTADAGEIGRAQAVQAECARVAASIHMNPVLLKPNSDDGSQVVVHGRPIGNFNAREYFSQKAIIARAIKESYEKLAGEYEVLVLEGAGSPAEINLKDNDLVNMKMAELADARCVLVSDIDRGGVFAALVGTLDLLTPHERGRVDGLIINKFRGDLSLFSPGIEWIERRTGKKVWGVIPFDRELWIEEEDSVAREPSAGHAPPFEGAREALEVAVVLLPRMSNATDFEILGQEPGIRLRYLARASDLGSPDLLILPGTKSTVADLQYLIEKGFREAILDYAARGGRILGICGGYQMLGEKIQDPDALESGIPEINGFSFFQMRSKFFPEKVLRQVRERVSLRLFGSEIEAGLTAYEIHMGRTTHEQPYEAFGEKGAVHPSGRIAGTYYHGLFESGEFRRSFFAALAKDAGKKIPSSEFVSAQPLKEKNYSRLARMLEQNLDLGSLKSWLGRNSLHQEPSTEIPLQ